MTEAAPFTSLGKQVLRGALHFADARDAEAAAVIADTLNDCLQSAPGIPADVKEVAQQIAAYLDREAEKTPRARLRARTLRVAASNVRAGLYEENENG